MSHANCTALTPCGVSDECASWPRTRQRQRFLALVRDDELHAGRLADDAAGRLPRLRDDVGDQSAHADAAHFLVVRKREMQRSLEPAFQEPRRKREALPMKLFMSVTPRP